MTQFSKAIYHSKLKVAQFITHDNRVLLRYGGSLPWRLFNCGDLSCPIVNGTPTPKYTKNHIGFANPKDSEHHFFIFPDYETGRAELKASLQRRYMEKTIPEMLRLFAPSKDGNNTEKYIKDLCAESGVDKHTKLGNLDDARLELVLDGIEKLEGYHRDKETRKEEWRAFTQIQASDGSQPVEGEEVVVLSGGKETSYKSNAAGLFPPIVHGAEPAELHHRTADGNLKKLTDLHPDKGQRFNLVNKVAEFFGVSAPVKAPERPIENKEGLLYVVEEKDNLGKIAAKFKRLNATVKRIKQDNQLKTDTIYRGQVLGINMVPPKKTQAEPAKKAPASSTTPKPPDKSAATSEAPSKEHSTKTEPAQPTKAASIPKAAASAPTPTKSQSPTVSPDNSLAKAESTNHKATPAVNTTAARSKEGAGEPLALIKPEDGVVPWMKYAIAEAKRWNGKREADIEKSINYHKIVKDDMSTMVGDNNPWCAAFANWCLMSAGYPIKNPKEAGYIDAADLSRAHGFMQVNVKDKDQGPVELDAKGKPKKKKIKTHMEVNPLYFKIETPIYGAIAVETSSHGHGHHVGFVYGRSGKNKICVLGGNQDDAICFAPIIEKEVIETKTKIDKNGKEIETKSKTGHLQFYLPVSYSKTYESAPKTLDDVDAGKLNKEINFVHSKPGTAVRTR